MVGSDSSDLEVVSFSQPSASTSGRTTRASTSGTRPSTRLQPTTSASHAQPPQRSKREALSRTASAASVAPAAKRSRAVAPAVVDVGSDSSEAELLPPVRPPPPQPIRSQSPASSAASAKARQPSAADSTPPTPPPAPVLADADPSPPSQHLKARRVARSPSKAPVAPHAVDVSPVASTSRALGQRTSDARSVESDAGRDEEAQLDDFFTRKAPATAKPLRRPGQKRAQAAARSPSPPARRSSPELSSTSESDSGLKSWKKKKPRQRSATPSSSDDDDPATDAAPWATKKRKLNGASRSFSSPKKQVLLSGADKKRAQLAKPGQASVNRTREGRKARLESESDTDPSPRTSSQDRAKGATLTLTTSSEQSSDEGAPVARRADRRRARRLLSRSSSPAEDSRRVELERKLNRLRKDELSPESQRHPSQGHRFAADASDSELEFEETLAPELQEAARKAKALRRQSGVEVVEQSGPVAVAVVMKLDPGKRALAEWDEAHISQYEKPYNYSVNSNATLESVYAAVAKAKSVAKADLVLTYNFTEVIPYAKPSAFGFKPGQTFNLRAWHRPSFDKWRQDRDARRDEALSPEPTSQLGQDGKGLSSSAVPAAQDEEEQPVDIGPPEGMIRLTLRGPTSSVGVQVKPTFSIEKLLQHYFKTQSIDRSSHHKMWLAFDGDKLDLSKTVGDYEELEDEETVDVVESK